MTRGVRWALGGGLAVVLAGCAAFVGFFGGVWALVGGFAGAADPAGATGGTRFFLDAGSGLLVLSGVLVALALAVLGGTACWAHGAPAAAPRPAGPGSPAPGRLGG